MSKARPDEDIGFNWLALPGIFCDTYAASYFRSSNAIRITFGEYTNKDHQPYYRTAVVLPLSDAKRLRATLTRLIKEAEEPEEGEAEPPTP